MKTIPSIIATIVIVTLVALAWSSLAFCGEIHVAAKNGDLEKVKMLLKTNPDLVFSSDTNGGWTPLHWAAYGGQKEVVEFLLANKADVNAKAIGGRTPLHTAGLTGHHKDVVELLLANKADANAKANGGETCLQTAASRGDKDVVELLLTYKADVNAKTDGGRTPLLTAAGHGFKDVVELLLANKADVNAKDNTGSTPLHYAAVKHKDVAELLRQNGGHE